MADAAGWKFVLFSVVFYLFLGLVLSLGGNAYFADQVIDADFTAGNYTTSPSYADVTVGNYISYIWQNPLSSVAWLVWLGTAFLIVDIYVIVTSLIP